MKGTFCIVACFLALTFGPCPVKADLFGGDVAVLSQILIQAISQLMELKKILSTGSDTLDLLNEINRGINDSLRLLKSLDPNQDPGIYRDWENVSEAVGKLQAIYGTVPNSPEAQVQKDTDQSVAEAVSFNNSFYKWTKDLDTIGEEIKSASHDVSPGGAQKLTAEALGLIIQVLNQSLRAQATSIKLQAQSMAIENRKEKEGTKDILTAGGALSTLMKSEKTNYQIPRF